MGELHLEVYVERLRWVIFLLLGGGRGLRYMVRPKINQSPEKKHVVYARSWLVSKIQSSLHSSRVNVNIEFRSR